jgi:hypothetical protein
VGAGRIGIAAAAERIFGRMHEQLAPVTPRAAMEASWKPHPPRYDLQKICSSIRTPAFIGET